MEGSHPAGGCPSRMAADERFAGKTPTASTLVRWPSLGCSGVRIGRPRLGRRCFVDSPCSRSSPVTMDLASPRSCALWGRSPRETLSTGTCASVWGRWRGWPSRPSSRPLGGRTGPLRVRTRGARRPRGGVDAPATDRADGRVRTLLGGPPRPERLPTPRGRPSRAHPGRGSTSVPQLELLRSDRHSPPRSQHVRMHLSGKFLALLALVHNAAPFRGGKRRRKTPLSILGTSTPPGTWMDWVRRRRRRSQRDRPTSTARS